MTVADVKRRVRTDEFLEWLAFDAWREQEREHAANVAEMKAEQ